jgi:glycosyltransferase involved in cell wall biosynthesis
VENIPTLIKKLKGINNKRVEIILVNNGSTDNSKEVLQKNINFKIPKIRIINLKKNIGYGHGIMSGVKIAKGEIIAWTHADLQTEVQDVIDAHNIFKKKENNEYNILKGKRIGRGMFDGFFTFGMSVLVTFLIGIKLSDINAQPKMFHRKFLKHLREAPEGFSLDLYFLIQAKNNGFTILEHPVIFGKRYRGESKGGGSLSGKIKLIIRTVSYINKLKNKV